MNKVFLIGNLTRDPELTETPNGISVCRFSIAVTRSYSQDGERKTDFFNCIAWRTLGENLARYQRKGGKISVIGSIQIREYEGRDGVKKTVAEIIASEIEFLSSKSATASDDGGNPPEKPCNSGQGSYKRPTLLEIDDDGDLPF